MKASATSELRWDRLEVPGDVERIEAVPLADRLLPATTYELLRRAAERWPDRVAVSVIPATSRWSEPVSLTYAALLATTAQVAAALVRRGVTSTTPVGIISPNCAQVIPALLGAQAAGIAVPLNGGLGVEHLAALLRRSGARLLIVASPDLDASIWAQLEKLAARGDLDHVLVLDPTDGTRTGALTLPGVRTEYLADAAASEPSSFADPHVASDLAAIFHTGGTTGIPKLAALTHANQVTDAWLIAADSTAYGGEVGTVFAALPLFHVNALHVTLLAPMFAGYRVVWASPLGFRDPALFAVFWKLVERYGIVTMSAVPTVYAALAGCPVDADISSLRVAAVGASALPPAVRSAFEGRTGVPLLEGYGLTEATCVSVRGYATDQRPGSVGKRLPYQRLRAVTMATDGTWHDVSDGRVGTLLISGPTVFAGYVVGRDADGCFLLDDQGKVHDGWLDTGDVARIEDGFVYLTGRAKDVIIRGGHNIDPVAIEDALSGHPQVTGAAAVGRPDPHSGEVPVAYVTLVAGATTTEADLAQFVAKLDLEPAAKPRHVSIVTSLPMTDLGKLYKLPLRADAARRAIHEALAGWTGIDDVDGMVRDGSARVIVRTAPGADLAGIRQQLERYSIECEVVPS